MRFIVAVSDVASRQWRFYDNVIFEGGPAAIPYQTLRGVNLNKMLKNDRGKYTRASASHVSVRVEIIIAPASERVCEREKVDEGKNRS